MTLTHDLVSWTEEQRCEKAVEALGRNGFHVLYCRTEEEARAHILTQAEDATTIGFVGSMSIADLGIAEQLRSEGKELLIHSQANLTREGRIEIMRRQLTCDLLLTGCNAVTLSGAIVNVDATGNRVASMIFGPRKVIAVAGRNKLVDGTAADAIRRIKEWAAPPNARRLNFNTPCAKTGFCSDCSSPDRICRITTVIDRKPRLTDFQILVVNADMGF